MARLGPIQYVPAIGYNSRGKAAIISPTGGQQVRVQRVDVNNRTGSAMDAGVCVKHAATGYKAWTLTAASTPDAAEVTTALQAGTAQNFAGTVNNAGFLVQFKRKFNFIGVNVSQAQAGSPVYAYSYYDGSAYQTLTTISVPTDYTGTGTNVIVFPAPSDWAVGTTAAVGGDTALYSIRVLATTAPSTAVQVDDLWVASFLGFQEALADNGTTSVSYSENNPLMLEAGEGIMPYFGTASAANLVSGYFSLML